MAQRILISWTRTDRWRIAIPLDEAAERFQTTDPAQVAAELRQHPQALAEWEDDGEGADGEGVWLDVTADCGEAVEEDEGVWWLREGRTPAEHTGPFPDPGEAFAYWQERGTGLSCRTHQHHHERPRPRSAPQPGPPGQRLELGGQPRETNPGPESPWPALPAPGAAAGPPLER